MFVQFTFFKPTGEFVCRTSDISAQWVRKINSVGVAIIEINKSKFYNFEIFSTEDLLLIIETSKDNQHLVVDGQTIWFLRKFKDNGNTVVLTFKDANSLFERRINAYLETSEKSQINLPANLALIEIFRNNFGDSVTNVNRDLSNIISYVPGGLYVPSISKSIQWKTILTTFKEICQTTLQNGTRLYFDLLYVSNTDNEIKLKFVTYVNSRGNLLNTVINVTDKHFTLTNFEINYDIANVAYVTNSNFIGAQLVATFETNRSKLTQFSRYEVFQTIQSLSEKSLIDEAKNITSEIGNINISGELDVSNSKILYGLGDIVALTYESFSFVCEIESISQEYQNGIFTKKLNLKVLNAGNMDE